MATKDTYIYGLGRRKAATARVRLYKGKGEITINDTRVFVRQQKPTSRDY